MGVWKTVNMKSTVLLCTALLFLAGCSARLPSEDTAYRIACEALGNDASLLASHPKAVPFEEAGLYLAKNAGCVLLPFQFTNEKGEVQSASYTVWLKRVERRWTAERAYITPTYPVEASQP
jgi:hypothetical protein